MNNSTLSLWTVLIIVGLLTFGMRLSSIILVGHTELPPLLRRALRFVPPAVLTAIFIPEMLMPSGRLDISFGNARLFAGVAAILVAWRTRSVVLTIIAGMIILWILIPPFGG